MKKLTSAITALLVLPSVVSAHAVNAQKFFDAETKKRCPSHHIEWIGDGSYDEIIEAYEAKMPPYLQKNIDRIADYSHQCSDVQSGFYCLWQVSTDAYQKLNRLDDFTDWTCRHVRCREAADCDVRS